MSTINVDELVAKSFERFVGEIAARMTANAPDKPPVTGDLLWSLMTQCFDLIKASDVEGSGGLRYVYAILDEISEACVSEGDFDLLEEAYRRTRRD